MNTTFLAELMQKHSQTPEVPSTATIGKWAEGLMQVLFPEVTEKRLTSVVEINNELNILKLTLLRLLHDTKSCLRVSSESKVGVFFDNLPNIYHDLLLDIDAFVKGDPAAYSAFEVIRAYPGFYAIFIHRLAHQLFLLDIPFLPRILSEYAHASSGIDIHPAAQIGKSFFIDHGTGVVIGETCRIGNNVKIYQGVTLGALSIDKNMAGVKRHPTVEDNVIIYSGATILGGDTVIGSGSTIGGNVWLTKSVPPGTRVYHHAENRVVSMID